MCMLSEDEIRNWKALEVERLGAVVGKEAKRIALVTIGVLDGVLND